MKYEKSFTNPCYQDLMFRFMIRFTHALCVFGGGGGVLWGHIAHMLGMSPHQTLPSKALGGGGLPNMIYLGERKRSQLFITPLCLNTIETQQLREIDTVYSIHLSLT
jgi:hypothetical protein